MIKCYLAKPDLVFPKYKTVVLFMVASGMDMRDVKYHVILKTRTKWWLDKINSNIANDKKKKI